MRTEPTFMHVADAATASESRFAALYKTESRITGSPTQLVSEFIGAQIGVAAEAAVLAAQVDALKIAGRSPAPPNWSGSSPSTSTPAPTATTRGCSAW